MNRKLALHFLLFLWIILILANVSLRGHNWMWPSWIMFFSACFVVSLRGRFRVMHLLVLTILLAADIATEWNHFLFCYSGDDSNDGYPNPEMKHKLEFVAGLISGQLLWLGGGFLIGGYLSTVLVQRD